MRNIKVENIKSEKGKEIPNQIIIHDYEKGYTYFQSYKSVIVKYDSINHITYLDREKWSYSRTTSKYRNMFLGETTKDIKKKIKSGDYILIDLNED